MSYSLGVDLGAATCSAAARRGARIEPSALGESATTMPAVALPRADGSMLVGEPAEAACRFEPALVARTIASRLGEAEAQPIVIDGQLVDPDALTEALIGTVIQRTAGPGEWPGHLVLTYPLRHGGNVEPVLERASGRVTTSPVMLVPEPIAAMAKLTHDVELALDTTVAVIDFGGTNFDVTLFRRTETGFDLVGEPASLADFGGIDVDAAVLQHVEASIGDVTSQVRDDDHATMLALRRLRASCRAAKERLTTEYEAIVEVALPHARAQVQVTREDLERAIGPALTTAVDLIARTIEDAGLAIPDVHVLLLAGGSSRIPLLTRLITERIGLPIVADPMPELTVSLGAALFGEEDPAPALPAAAFDSLGAPIVGALWPPPDDLAGPLAVTSGTAAVPPDGPEADAIPLTLAGDDGAGWPADDAWDPPPEPDGAPGWDKGPPPAPVPEPWEEAGRSPALWDAPASGPSKDRPWDEPWDQPWEDQDPATYDPFLAPRTGAATRRTARRTSSGSSPPATPTRSARARRPTGGSWAGRPTRSSTSVPTRTSAATRTTATGARPIPGSSSAPSARASPSCCSAGSPWRSASGAGPAATASRSGAPSPRRPRWSQRRPRPPGRARRRPPPRSRRRRRRPARPPGRPRGRRRRHGARPAPPWRPNPRPQTPRPRHPPIHRQPRPRRRSRRRPRRPSRRPPVRRPSHSDYRRVMVTGRSRRFGSAPSVRDDGWAALA
jgi:molecular chaperone DnaK